MCTSCVNRKKMQPHSGRILVPVRRLSRKRLRTQRQPRTRPRPKSGEDESRPPRQQRSREWWSRRGKKSAFLWRLDTVSLGKHQRNGVERQQGATTTAQGNGAHVQSHRQGESLICAFYVCAVLSGNRPRWPCRFHPISLLLRKETGWSPKETRFWVPPHDMFGPTRLSHGLEAPTSQPTASS